MTIYAGTSSYRMERKLDMKLSASSLGFVGHPIYNMAKLNPDIGIEIFYEWGAETYWRLALDEIMAGRTGDFSIHAPYEGAITEMSLTEKVYDLYAYLAEPFQLYHDYHGTAYVVHMNAPYHTRPTPEEKAERLKRVEERLAYMNELCHREGIQMLVENLSYGRGLYTLCDHEDFLNIFRHNPELDCIIDTGHATLGKLDVGAIQRELGPRLKAYHVHDNDGIEDRHQRILTGIIDWEQFMDGACRYTPEATLVMEYSAAAVMADYNEDATTLQRMIRAHT